RRARLPRRIERHHRSVRECPQRVHGPRVRSAGAGTLPEHVLSRDCASAVPRQRSLKTEGETRAGASRRFVLTAVAVILARQAAAVYATRRSRAPAPPARAPASSPPIQVRIELPVSPPGATGERIIERPSPPAAVSTAGRALLQPPLRPSPETPWSRRPLD